MFTRVNYKRFNWIFKYFIPENFLFLKRKWEMFLPWEFVLLRSFRKKNYQEEERTKRKSVTGQYVARWLCSSPTCYHCFLKAVSERNGFKGLLYGYMFIKICTFKINYYRMAYQIYVYIFFTDVSWFLMDKRTKWFNSPM